MAVKKAKIGSQWMTITDISSKLSEARQNKKSQSSFIKKLEADVVRRVSEVERTLSDLPSRDRLQLVERTRAGARKEIKAGSANHRLVMMRKAGGIQKSVVSAKTHYRSPVQMLMRHDLGSARRNRIQLQIQHSGSVELASLAELAAATKDRELGAALCARNSSLKPKERTFSSHELAYALIGEDFNQVTAAVKEIDRITQEVAQADTAFETGRNNPKRSIEIELMRRDEQQYQTEEIEE